MNLKRALVKEIPYLRRFARSLVRDPAVADDLVQDCIERALSRLHLFNREQNLRTWLFAILRNIFINAYRREAKRGPHIDIENVSENELAREADQHSYIDAMDIANALELLQTDQREVLLLIAVEELTYKETAEVIGAPIGTVMSRLSRARKNLKSLLEGREHSELRRVK